MRPLKLKLTGFAGIASGRGKSEVVIDFADVTPGAQIVALSGPNGAGKTTIMDNLHPFRVMPSRAASPTPTAFSFYEHIVGGEGTKELDWEHEGVQYRSVLKFRATAKTKKQECFLFVINGAQATPWSDKTSGMQSDGKADTYDRAVECILGKPEVFFTAQFSAQGKQPIGKMTAGEVKSLLGQMLGMDKISALGTKAQAVVKELKPHINAAHDTVAKLQAQAGSEDIDRRMQELQAQSLANKEAQVSLNQVRDKALGALSVAKREFEQQEQNRSMRAGLLTQIVDAKDVHQSKRRQLQERHGGEIQLLRDQLAQTGQSVQSANRQIRELSSRIVSQETLAAKTTLMAETAQQLDGLSSQRASTQEQIAQCQPAVAKLDGIRSAITELQQHLARAKTSGEHIAQALEAATATAALLGEVPCHGTDMAGACKLLAQANKAAKESPVIESKLTDARKAFKEGRNRLSDKQGELDVLIQQEAASKRLSGELRELEMRIAQCNSLLAQKQYVDAAIQSLPALREQLGQVQGELQNATAVEQQLHQRLVGQQQAQRLEVEQFEVECQAEVRRLNNQLNALPALVEESDLKSAQSALTQVDSQLAQAKADEDRVAQSVREVMEKAQRAAQAKNDLRKAQERVNALSEEMAQWTLLAKALGTDGIIAMQIDDAGPAISLIANQLLQDCYGGRFQISLITQTQTATGIQKESFLIQVEDTQRGESKLLDAMSGGEKVWINECLVRAIALHMAQTADTKFETLFSDESDGALDPERKRQYMQMKRSVLERGGYSREYLITQTPELLNLCDAVIDVANL